MRASVDARWTRTLCLIVLVLLSAGRDATVKAQAPSAALSGTVTDESGAVVVGVDLTLANAGSGVQQRLATDAQGAYVFASLPPGTYTLTAWRTGFAPVVIDSLVLTAGERRSVPLRLSVALAEGVAVVARNRVPTRGARSRRAPRGIARGRTWRSRPRMRSRARRIPTVEDVCDRLSEL